MHDEEEQEGHHLVVPVALLYPPSFLRCTNIPSPFGEDRCLQLQGLFSGATLFLARHASIPANGRDHHRWSTTRGDPCCTGTI